MHDAARDGETGETRARLIAALRAEPATTTQLAALLGLSLNTVRSQLQRLERQAIVVRRSARLGPTKPAYLYALSPEAELRASRLYVPFLTQLLHVLAGRLDPTEFDALMRETGRGLLPQPLPRGSLAERVSAAAELLNDFGGLATATPQGQGYLIRSQGCPLAASTGVHPEACNAVESLLAEYIEAPVSKCCDRDERLRCCFEVRPRRSPRRRAAACAPTSSPSSRTGRPTAGAARRRTTRT
jgi:predicted ArsR family transcriptional regulator